MHSLLLVLPFYFLMASPAIAATQEPPTSNKKPEIVSLLGKPLYSQEDEKETLPPIQKELEADPSNPELMHKMGKQLTRLWRFTDGIEWMGRALQKKPGDDKILLDRGHAYINIRRFREAEEDLEQAAQKNDGEFSIFYHLALAHYYQERFQQAAGNFQKARDVSKDDDSIVAASDWLYMSLKRAGQDEEASKVLERISEKMEIRENSAYHARLLLYKGLKKEEELMPADANPLQVATYGYGIANWHFYNGRTVKAREQFEKIVTSPHWPAFGFIAAEVELARSKSPAQD